MQKRLVGVFPGWNASNSLSFKRVHMLLSHCWVPSDHLRHVDVVLGKLEQCFLRAKRKLTFNPPFREVTFKPAEHGSMGGVGGGGLKGWACFWLPWDSLASA